MLEEHADFAVRKDCTQVAVAAEAEHVSINKNKVCICRCEVSRMVSK